ncbi:hypothetical protein B0H14DRAFT_2806474 [Mycena olivaceomarginata]|nr:hypothetical protein B0H14DRAFT_2806474 [Mycena olivaceomarginata]
MNELRKSLYPGQIPVHVTVFPVFSLDEDEYAALFERLEEVAGQFEPWVLGECGAEQCNDWVAIRLWEEDGEGNGFGEIVAELKDWVPVDAVKEPHITVYRGPKSGAYIPYFGEWMGTAGIRKRLERLVDEYAADHGGNGLSVRVTGLQLLHKRQVVGLSSAAKYLSILYEAQVSTIREMTKVIDEKSGHKFEKEIMKSLQPASSWTETSASSKNNASKSKHSVSSRASSAKTKPSKKFTETKKPDMKVPKTKTIKAKDGGRSNDAARTEHDDSSKSKAGRKRKAKKAETLDSESSPTIRHRMPPS